MIHSVIFDMDGLLVDSEPFWRQAEMTVFSNYGITLTEDDCRSTTGMRVSEVAKHWSVRNPGKITDTEKVASEILAETTRLVGLHAQPMDGVQHAVELFSSLGLKMAVASSSAMSLINVVLDKLSIRQHFSEVLSAENLQHGKPHPEIFLRTAELLQTNPTECLVLEDSIYGVIAGKAACMKVIAVPDATMFERKEFVIADARLHSLAEIDKKLILSL